MAPTTAGCCSRRKSDGLQDVFQLDELVVATSIEAHVPGPRREGVYVMRGKPVARRAAPQRIHW